MSKTVMQELIDDLKNLKKSSKERNQNGSFDIGITFAIARAELRLEKEKEQHKETWDESRCQNDVTGNDDYIGNDYLDFEKYYNQTYNKNK